MSFGRFLRRVSNIVLPNLGAVGGFANGLIQGQGLGGAVRQGIGSGIQAGASMLAPGVGQAIGVSTPVAGAILGAGSGAINAKLGRRDVGTGALIGGGAGYLSGGGLSGGAQAATAGQSSLPSFLRGTAVDRLIPNMEDITGALGISSPSAEDVIVQRAQEAAGAGAPADGIASGFESFMKNNSGLLSAAGMGAQYLMSNKQSGAEKNLRDLAGRQGATARSFLEAGASGQLPQGLSEGIMQGYEAAKTSIRNKYAGLGLSGSTMEMQELNDLERRLASQKFDASMALVNQGMDASQIANNTYTALVNKELADDSALADALFNMMRGTGYSTAVGGGNG